MTDQEKELEAMRAMIGFLLIAVGGSIVVPEEIIVNGIPAGSAFGVTPQEDGSMRVEIDVPTK